MNKKQPKPKQLPKAVMQKLETVRQAWNEQAEFERPFVELLHEDIRKHGIDPAAFGIADDLSLMVADMCQQLGRPMIEGGLMSREVSNLVRAWIGWARQFGPAEEIDDRLPASWFREKAINPNTLDKARRDGRLKKSVQRTRRGEWQHSLSEVQQVFPHKFK